MGHNSINLINKEDIQPPSAKNRIHFQLSLLIFYNKVEFSDSVLKVTYEKSAHLKEGATWDELIGNLNKISLFTQANFTMLTIIHESKNYPIKGWKNSGFARSSPDITKYIKIILFVDLYN